MRTFEGDLRKDLEDPEFAAYFANAQAESARELLRAGVIKTLTQGGTDYKRIWIMWKGGDAIVLG